MVEHLADRADRLAIEANELAGLVLHDSEAIAIWPAIGRQPRIDSSSGVPMFAVEQAVFEAHLPALHPAASHADKHGPLCATPHMTDQLDLPPARQQWTNRPRHEATVESCPLVST